MVLQSFSHGDPVSSKNLVLLLHGFGDQATGILGSIGYSMSVFLPECCFVAINAPYSNMPYSVGFRWFDISDFREDVMYAGLLEASRQLGEFLDEKLPELGFPYSKVAVIGFSQGAILALHHFFRIPERCAGVVSYSGMLVKSDTLKSEIVSRPEVCLVHGTMDPVILFQAFGNAKAALDQCNVICHGHKIAGMGHCVNGAAMNVGISFLKRCFDR